MSISGLALSRVSHQAFGGLEAAYVRLCTHVCAHVFLCDTTELLSLFLSLSPPPSLSLLRLKPHALAQRVQICDRLGVLGVGHYHSLCPSAPSGKLALAQGRAEKGSDFNLFGKHCDK